MKLAKPIDIARCSENWIKMSWDFYSAGKILIAEFVKGNIELQKSVGKTQYDCKFIGERIILHASPKYCLAFSIELLVKAILVKSNPLFWIPTVGKMKFKNHKVYDLITENNIPVRFESEEKHLLKSLEDHIEWGRYPAKIIPNIQDKWNYSHFSPEKGWDPNEFESLIDSIKSKLDKYYSKV